jgi:hypothetical protein
MLLEFVVIYDFIAYRKKDNVLLIVCIGAHNFLVCVCLYIYIYISCILCYSNNVFDKKNRNYFNKSIGKVAYS